MGERSPKCLSLNPAERRSVRKNVSVSVGRGVRGKVRVEVNERESYSTRDTRQREGMEECERVRETKGEGGWKDEVDEGERESERNYCRWIQ